AGLSGMGDLIATCSSKLSRNHYVGEQIAKGRKLKEVLSEMKDVAEGVPTTLSAMRLAKQFNIHLPITAEVYKVLYGEKDPYQAMMDLMTRTPTSE
ncbi:MAG: NAD(P)H-dependent glycerol-3-phosphate dehydrogenase, partial [Candidatus Margulisiibacteriota bacterium]